MLLTRAAGHSVATPPLVDKDAEDMILLQLLMNEVARMAMHLERRLEKNCTKQTRKKKKKKLTRLQCRVNTSAANEGTGSVEDLPGRKMRMLGMLPH